jgi:hypothetical protein
MSGRGALADLSDAERAPDPAIQLYGNDGRWRLAAEPVDDAAGQTDAVSADPRAAVGPGLFFARAIRRLRPARPVALVPCAKGCVAIARWAPADGRDTLYGLGLARARQAAGLLWYQGENDAEAPAAVAAGWADAFAMLVARYRRDLGAPHLPVVAVELAYRPDRFAARYPSWALVQGGQARLAIPCVSVVSVRTGST